MNTNAANERVIWRNLHWIKLNVGVTTGQSMISLGTEVMIHLP